MNERIKELAKEAGITTNLDTDFYNKDSNKWVDYFSEKFAELIIQECVAIANKYDEPKLSGPGMIIAGQIESHFGIDDE